MYTTIHDDFAKKLKGSKDFRLRERRLNIGAAIKQIKESNRIRMKDLLDRTGLKRSCLNTLIQSGEMNTSQERFHKIVEALGVPGEDFIRIARETARYNFYSLKADEVPVLKYKGYEVHVFSPPSFSQRDFFWCLMKIQPGHDIANLHHETMGQVAGFVTHGHLKIRYGDRTYTVHTNQSFFFDPKIKHSFVNESSSDRVDFYLLFQLRPTPSKKSKGPKSSSGPISTAMLINQVRKELSPDPNRLLPLPTLAALSGIERDALVHLTYRETTIIPFEKIDLLANLTNYSFENIFEKAKGSYKGWIKIFTDQDKITVDSTIRHGVVFNSHTGMGMGVRKFSIFDANFESWTEGASRKSWSYTGPGFVGVSVLRGHIGIQYGRQPLQILKWGETLYVNTDVPITLVNMLSEKEAAAMGESKEAKVIVFSSSPIF